MPKPEWMVTAEAERSRTERKAFRKCMTCKNAGAPCGLTKNAGKGRMVMYECRRFPGVTFHQDTLACSSYE